MLDIGITWQFFSRDGDQLFETAQTGTLDLVTGAVALDGSVTEGARPGAPTTDVGQMTDAALSFAGVMTVGLPHA